jgi:SNF2 family DNA or RNA helicase
VARCPEVRRQLPAFDEVCSCAQLLQSSVNSAGDVGLACLAGIYLPLGLPEDRPEPTHFRDPTADDLGDISTARLLYNAARLSFRNGAGPFRCLAKLSFRPRSYQIVPLIMALRQETVRLLIADDVGVGKTVESLLVVRELLERRKIERFAVVCLPHLCEQWQEEIRNKLELFGARGSLARPSTVSPDDLRDISFYQFWRLYSVDRSRLVRHQRERVVAINGMG